ncbi:MAG: hypothetical protein GY788_16420 [bacterium]|nr:hypothetical protein [bacterium]
MSDVSQGDGWWKASDDKWYPPEQRPSASGGDQGSPAPSQAMSSDEEASGFPWLSWQVAVLLLGGLLLGAALGLALGGNDGDSETATTTAKLTEPSSTTTSADATTSSSTTTMTTTTITTTTTPASGEGSRTDPLPLGTTVPVGEWEVAVVNFAGDATGQVMAENQFNDPPDAGHVYSLVTLRATYKGADEGTAWLELAAGLVGDDQRNYSDTDCGAVKPNALNDQPSVFADGTVEGNFCLMVPSDQLPSGVLYVEPTFGSEDERAWFAQG